ncbi:hypothetical protein JHK84_050941 [Glycine max]|nr:hypothetical protein JHK84_050941 [Glycine max]
MEAITCTTLFQDIKWLQSITSLPILVKGVLSAQDSKPIKYMHFVSSLSIYLFRIVFSVFNLIPYLIK